MEKVIVRHVKDVTPVPCPCGQSTRIITIKDTPKLNVHRTEIKNSQRHYHKNTTEVYYILDGNGTMIVDEETVDLSAGVCVYIPPGVRHQVNGHVQTLIMGVPAFKDADEFFD